MKRILNSLFFCTIVFISNAQPVNDEPAGAVSLPISSTYFANAVSGTTLAATTTIISGSSSVADDDVWYKFEVTGAANSNVSIAFKNIVFIPTSPSNYLHVKLWNPSLTTGYVGSFNGLYNQFSLGIGTWYLQVYTDDVGSQRANFDIGIRNISATAPSNDDCIGATTLTSFANTCGGATLGSNINATTSTPALAIPAATNDVWYKFTALATKHYINLTDINWAPGVGYPVIGGVATANVNIEIGQGVCGSFTTLGNGGSATTYETPNLSIGTEYFIRISSVLSSGTRVFDYNICLTHYPLPVNNNVAGAITITPASGNCFDAASNVSGTTNGANQSPQTFCASGTDIRDVWYNFTATSNYFRASLEIPISSQTPNIELWNTDATTKIKCENSENLESAVTNGTNYKLRIAGYNGTYLNNYILKTLCTVPPQTNDNCSTPTTLPLNSNIALPALTAQSTAGASQLSFIKFDSSCVGANTGGDLWYNFVATKNSVTISLRNVITTGSTNMSIQLFDAGCTNPTPLAFFCGNFLNANTTPGHSYAVRIMKADGCETVTFDIHTEVPPAPINDECSNAINLPINTVSNCTSGVLKVNGSTLNATESLDVVGPGCGFGNNDDVWFSFTTTSGNNNTLLNITDKTQNTFSSGAALLYALYSGTSCGAKSFVECGYISSFADMTQVTTLPNTKYYLRIYSSDLATQFSFKIGIVSLANSTNISCATATTLTATSDMTATSIFSNTLNVPTDEGDCYGGTTGSRGVWYSFVATATNHFLNIGCVYALGNGNASAQAKVYSGNCAALTQLYCFANISYEGGTMSGLTIGQTYYILVIDFTPNSEPIAFSISVVGGNAINDESVTAIPLIQDVICNSTSASTNFSTVSISPTIAPHPSAYTYNGDVWFKFIASTTTVNLKVTNNQNNLYFRVYNDALTATISFNGVATGEVSSTEETLALSGLTVGQNYYIRAILCTPPLSSTPVNGIGRNFSICVFGVPSLDIADASGLGCTTANGPVTSTNSNKWLHITDGGKILSSIFDSPGGAGMGLVNGYYYLNTSSVRTITASSGASLKYMDRNFEVTPTTQPTNPVRVKLYFSKAELDALIASSLTTPNPIYSIADLKIGKLSLAPCNTVLTATDISNYYTVLSFGEVSATVNFIEIEVPSFSSFFLGPQTFSILPSRIEYFTGSLNGNNVTLDWNISDTKGVNAFEIERNFNGEEFEKIETAQPIPNIQKYQFQDLFQQKITYYRIKTILDNGKYNFSKTVVLKPFSSNNDFSIYPNPVNENRVQVSLTTKKFQEISIKIVNTNGQIIYSKQNNVLQGNQILALDINNLQRGSYYLSIYFDEKWTNKIFTKIN